MPIALGSAMGLGLLRVPMTAGLHGSGHVPLGIVAGAAVAHGMHVEPMLARRQALQLHQERGAFIRRRDHHRAQGLPRPVRADGVHGRDELLGLRRAGHGQRRCHSQEHGPHRWSLPAPFGSVAGR